MTPSAHPREARVHTDLGTWRGPQAQAVIDVLRRAGLSPQTENGFGGTRITVPATEHDRAHQVLLGAMDHLARAAHDGPPVGEIGYDAARPLVTQRLRGSATVVGLVVALLVCALLPAGTIRASAFALSLAAFGVLWVRGRQHPPGGSGVPGSTDDDRP